jgi:hypothetical protein
VKYSLVPQVYTTIAFGASIFLWIFLSKPMAIMPSMEGRPRYSIHLVYSLEFFLQLSTTILWLIVFLFSLYNLRRQAIKLSETVRHNLFLVCLVLGTAIVALSGCVLYSEPTNSGEYSDGLVGLPPLPPPNPLGLFHVRGILLCETAWIIKLLSRYLRRLASRIRWYTDSKTLNKCMVI